MIYNAKAGTQVIGCLLKDPTIFARNEINLTPADFEIKLHKIVFTAAYNLFYQGVKDLNAITVEEYLSDHPVAYQNYKESKGVEFILNALDISEMRNFDYNYELVKKYSLLRELKQSQNFNIDYFYPEGVIDVVVRQEAIERLNKSSREDILKYYMNNITLIQRNQLVRASAKMIEASEGGMSLKEQLKKSPEFGVNLNNEYMNTIFRGARKTKFYLESASQGSGKTRTMIANACKTAIPFYYDTKERKWIVNGSCSPTLYVTTEMSLDEVQTIMWAYLSGVDEDIILNGTYKGDEEERVDTAIKLIEYYKTLFIYLLPDPNIKELEVNVRRECIQHEVEYLFYDYIHSSPALLSEFSGINVREDVALGLMSNALKNLANELNIFIWTATQTNSIESDMEFADTRVIRGRQYCLNTPLPIIVGVQVILS